MRVFLFGANGMLGRYVFKVLSEEYCVLCFFRKDFDIEKDSYEKLNNLFISNTINEKDVIINCAGTIPQKTEDDEYRKYIRVNTLFPHKLKEQSDKYKCNFIHITTDCVFDGKTGNYSIDDKHTSRHIYGVTKSEGEPENATVIRTSIIGEELSGKKSLLEWIKSNKNGTINGFTNHYWNGVTCLTLSRVLKIVIQKNDYWKGVKHICSPTTVNKYELCKYINEIYELNIKINHVSDDVTKNMTLIGANRDYSIENIYQQILEMKNYSLETT